MAEGLSGFPEWLPEQELVQQQVIATVRRQFELHAFTPLHTRSIEKVEDLLSQGETDKEIFAVQRLHAQKDDEARLALHYDLTVPFARYTLEHRNQLIFPFRRYQIQPAWRGERPQLGRYREFLQADADVIGNGTLPVRFDAEMVHLLRTTLDALPVPPVRLLVNNRKLLEGFYRGLGIDDITGTLRIVDKLAKIKEQGVTEALSARGLASTAIDKVLALSRLSLESAAEVEKVRALEVRHDLLDEGLSELGQVLEHSSSGRIVGALHIARGFDYYTGTVVEGVLEGHPELGSVCSGGRYDNLASSGGAKLPGMGVSIGITRLIAYCFHLKLLAQKRRSPATVLVVVHADEERAVSNRIAASLRARNIACLVSDSAAAYGKQIKVALQLGIPYVWFPARGDGPHEVKDLRSETQAQADPETWVPAEGATSLIFA
jgi:histidyl-tRNA synthetase